MRAYVLNNKNVLCVWSLLTNQMFVKYSGVWSLFMVPSRTFIKIQNIKNNNTGFLSKLNISFFIFSKRKYKYFYMSNLFKFFYFYKGLHLNESSLITGYYVLLDLVGLGFRISKISERLYYFELGWATGVYFLVPLKLRINVSIKKRKILIFSSDFNCVSNILASFLHLRKMSPYRIGGFMQNKIIVRLRTGKQR